MMAAGLGQRETCLALFGVRQPPSTAARVTRAARGPLPRIFRLGAGAPASLQISSSTSLFPTFGTSSEAVAGPEGRWGRGGRQSSSSQAGRSLLRRLLRPLSSSLRLGVPEGRKRRRWRGRGGGEPPPEARAGGECTQGKWPHSRTSGPPSRPSVYLFTFAGSSNTSAFSELRSTGAALVRPGPQLLAPAHRSLTPPVGGGVSSEQQPTRQERKVLWESEERPGHTPRVGAWLGVPVGEAGWWGAPSAPNPRSSLNLRRPLGLKASWEALCSHPSPFRLVRACWVGASSRGV